MVFLRQLAWIIQKYFFQAQNQVRYLNNADGRFAAFHRLQSPSVSETSIGLSCFPAPEAEKAGFTEKRLPDAPRFLPWMTIG